jgi:hypothetical protein
MKKLILFAFFIISTVGVFSQCEMYAKKCNPLLRPYKSDGQFHRALLTEGETAEFIGTFHAGNTYRIVGCTGPYSDTLIYRLLDANYNIIFSNDDYDYPNYWDFKFNATDRYFIQAELMEDAGSGCAVILIGFHDRK